MYFVGRGVRSGAFFWTRSVLVKYLSSRKCYSYLGSRNLDGGTAQCSTESTELSLAELIKPSQLTNKKYITQLWSLCKSIPTTATTSTTTSSTLSRPKPGSLAEPGDTSKAAKAVVDRGSGGPSPRAQSGNLLVGLNFSNHHHHRTYLIFRLQVTRRGAFADR